MYLCKHIVYREAFTSRTVYEHIPVRSLDRRTRIYIVAADGEPAGRSIELKPRFPCNRKLSAKDPEAAVFSGIKYYLIYS